MLVLFASGLHEKHCIKIKSPYAFINFTLLKLPLGGPKETNKIFIKILVVWQLLSGFCLAHPVLCDCDIEEKGLSLCISKWHWLRRETISESFCSYPCGTQSEWSCKLSRGVSHNRLPDQKVYGRWRIVNSSAGNGRKTVVNRSSLRNAIEGSASNGIPQAVTMHNSLHVSSKGCSLHFEVYKSKFAVHTLICLFFEKTAVRKDAHEIPLHSVAPLDARRILLFILFLYCSLIIVLHIQLIIMLVYFKEKHYGAITDLWLIRIDLSAMLIIAN